jgi:hypothetical protein
MCPAPVGSSRSAVPPARSARRVAEELQNVIAGGFEIEGCVICRLILNESERRFFAPMSDTPPSRLAD